MKTILITGATDGIGLETARLLAKEGHKLLIHGRSLEKLEKLKSELHQFNSNIRICIADLSSFEETKKMAEEILQNIDKIDIIINNAGVYVLDNCETQDGLDARFVVNTIAPYLMTKMLLPILNNGGRIINLSSRAQMEVDFEAMKIDKKLPNDCAYAQSKLAITMWAMELAEELGDKAVVVSINPRSFLGSKMVKIAYGKEGYDLAIGADILYRAALSDEFTDKTGCYYDNDDEMFEDPHPFALVKENRVRLVKTMDEIIAGIL